MLDLKNIQALLGIANQMLPSLKDPAASCRGLSNKTKQQKPNQSPNSFIL